MDEENITYYWSVVEGTINLDGENILLSKRLFIFRKNEIKYLIEIDQI